MDALGSAEIGIKKVNNHWAFRFGAMFCVDGKNLPDFGLFIQGFPELSRLSRLPQQADEP